MKIINDSTCIFLDFRPSRPIWREAVREVVYIKRWQKMMLEMMKYAVGETDGETCWVDHVFLMDGYGDAEAQKTLHLNNIFYYTPNANDTRIATDVIRWLGSMDGRVFLETANQLTQNNDTVEFRETIYHGLFGQKNIRTQDRSETLIMHRLCDEFKRHGDTAPKLFYDTNEFDKHRDNILMDQNVVMLMINWLASDKGQQFIQGCERNLNIKQRREQEDRLSQTMHPVQRWLSQRPS